MLEVRCWHATTCDGGACPYNEGGILRQEIWSSRREHHAHRRARDRRGGMKVWSSRSLEPCCRRSDVEVWSDEGALQACRCISMEV